MGLVSLTGKKLLSEIFTVNKGRRMIHYLCHSCTRKAEAVLQSSWSSHVQKEVWFDYFP